MSEAGDGEPCRLDVWLWRARLFKTRSLAARFVEEGRLRLLRGSVEMRIDKPGRAVKPGDGLVFAMGGRVMALRIIDRGHRRGPAAEARALYVELDPL